MLRQTSQQQLLLSFNGRQICKVGISTALIDGYTMSFKQPRCSSACRSFPPPFRVKMVDKRLRSPLLGTAISVYDTKGKQDVNGKADRPTCGANTHTLPASLTFKKAGQFAP
eukprot:1415877-Pleurochrysis_carterae.AAC.1